MLILKTSPSARTSALKRTASMATNAAVRRIATGSSRNTSNQRNLNRSNGEQRGSLLRLLANVLEGSACILGERATWVGSGIDLRWTH
ncbi:unnamed protein product [Zymoseptoria tritici ST99CH_3D1]|uniref:Uncharacterized protein n=1 Tax=Zymoseptoria tritici ST99CH_1E4 TaxID=1276532 RepID=A0A2H1GHE1_ZYMTR|nr:unnamed protein product [Zymoseptoria tritici ST99CH_1E4]SMR54532.1 unnamed protein product [Zymoseptoria tritici ST99CH_3D1]